MKKNSRTAKEPPLDWDTYIRASLEPDYIDRCRRACYLPFRDQREALQTLLGTLKPRRIACLGAGCLNDIPIEKFLQGGSEVFLVDWIPQISEEGFKLHIIQSDQGKFSCFLCHLPCKPEQFCASWTDKVQEDHDVCGNFRMVEDPIPRCENFRPSIEPHFVTTDVTLGRATSFARRVGRLVGSSGSPVQAIRKAMDEAHRCSTVSDPIQIPSDSIDLVTSSMVVSQFDYEPFTFFSKILKKKFGDRLFAQEKRILKLLESLKNELFRVQAEGHIREMHRLTQKNGGKAYFSVELFRRLEKGERFFMVDEIPHALDLLGKYFFFEFEAIPPERTLRSVKIGNGTSIIQSFLLIPKPYSEIRAS